MPYAEAAELLARRQDWPELFDVDVLRHHEVPLVASVYPDDLYVDAALSLQTAATIGRTEVWRAEDLEHDAVCKGTVLDRPLGMRPTP